MSDPAVPPAPSGSPHRPPTQRRTAVALLGATFAALAGGALAALVAHAGALAFAEWSDLGTAREHAFFARSMAVLGFVGGIGAGLRLAFAVAPPRKGLPALLSGTLAGMAGFALAIGHLAFAVTTSPPPVKVLILAQIRLGGEAWSDIAVVATGHRSQAVAQRQRREVRPDGTTLVEALVPVPEPSGVRALVLLQGDRELARFSLDLPGDPPATLYFSHWLTPDGRDGEAARMDMRFRIERQVMR